MPDESPQIPPGFSNYPRKVSVADTRPGGVYLDSISLACRLVVSKLAVWTGSFITVVTLMVGVALVVNIVLDILFYGSVSAGGIFSWENLWILGAVQFAQALMLNCFLASWLYMGVKQARGESIRLRDTFIGFRRFGSLFISSLWGSIVVTVGLLFLVAPGLFMFAALAFVPILILDQNLSPVEAMKLSFRTLDKHWWKLAGLLLVVGIFAAAGYCGLLVGLLFTIPVFFVTVGITYNTFFPGAPIHIENQPIGLEPPKSREPI